ncbi:MAG: PilT/PilU family type 4a pilus ATPase [Elusimicrobiota bacterium]|nr:PilT/PilU family type 4a pilus ATPase [Elusimicrobiota bacterium]
MELNDLFKEMLNKKASDMHIRPNSKVYLRIDGVICPLETIGEISSAETEKFAFQLMNDEQKKTFAARHECDLAVTIHELGRLRVNVYQQRGLINIAVRYIPVEVPTIEQLNLPQVLKKLAESPRGLILVTGPTGCGKSSTLAAMIEHINSSISAHIITIEDPIEFIYKDKKSIISQRELGIDTLTYAEALRHVVRQDPDVILIGEMRDLETMSAALTAAQLGHLVLSTLHTRDTIQTVSRVVDLFPPYQQNQIRYQLADTLVGVVSQRLLLKSTGKGQIPAVEVLVATPLIKKYIEENNLNEILNLLKQGEYYGMQTFNRALLKLYREGKVKLENALESATSPEEFMLAIKGIETSTESAQRITLERFTDRK